jgi:pectate lyase
MRRIVLFVALAAGCREGADVSLGDLPWGAPEGGSPMGDASSDGPARDADFTLCPSDAEPVTAAKSTLLAECVGFGCSATGGLRGCVYHVTSLADSGPGTLREAAQRLEPLWIVFDVAGNIDLQSSVIVESNKTIDGRGKAVALRGYGLIVGAARENVVIENLTFVDGTEASNNDAIQILGASSIWIDHCSLSNYPDGLIDITHAATDVTVSWSLFTNHDLVMLIGRSADDVGDAAIRVTLHHNWWNQIGSYAPRARFGKVHTFNNLIDRWKSSASAMTMGGQLYSEANIFVALNDKGALATSQGSDPIPGKARSTGDWLQNDATVQENERDAVFVPSIQYAYTAEPAIADLQSAIMTGAGAKR